jgi:uncharacterized protein (UPF0261 family)
MPLHGTGEWDREGADLHDREGLEAFMAELQATLPANVEAHPIEGHINDPIFAETALAIFDGWCADGTVKNPA